ncbi:NAD(+)--rifampin ADP-ribosyltransferase [Streptomyces sp. NBC_01242]|uniref:NAD(+)--rifampin ADP-ribosyltransferase n=1 Tax=Streptomyces sp. NBC_01242 TaxID=2903795 RepID=UPI00225A2DE4|nr:NAD(+)--rifampin ADP-ribosyltransferase [Streptomyces sp. NBC_01242]MCX4799669.1 NAD(+)--rifampin ADP-ribosyltransferase [Streptomyces sp. NBC_01242]
MTDQTATSFFRQAAGIPESAPKGLRTSEQTWGHYRAEHAAFGETDQKQYKTTKAAQQHADEICDKEGLPRVKVRAHRAQQDNYSRYDSQLFVKPERRMMSVVSLGKASYNEGALIHELAHHKHFTSTFPDGKTDAESRAKYFEDDEGGHGGNFQQYYHQMISDHHTGGQKFANSVRNHASKGGFWKASSLRPEATGEEGPENASVLCLSPTGRAGGPRTATAFFRQAAEQPKTYTWKGQAYGHDGGYIDKEYQVQGPLYHGGGKRLRDGDQVKPGRKSNYPNWGDEPGKSQHVYFTTRKDTAADYARQSGGHVYEVEPTGDFRMDHNGDDYKTKHPLNVVRRLDPEEWHSDDSGSPRTAGRGKPRSQPRTVPGAAEAGADTAGTARAVGADEAGAGTVGPRQVSFHPAAQKELSKLDAPSRKRVAATVDTLAQGGEGLQTHALTGPLKGWRSTKATRGHRVLHRDLDDGTLHVGYVGLHDYDKAINRLVGFFRQAYVGDTPAGSLARGMNVSLPADKHAFIHDERQPLPARAHLLLSELKKPSDDINNEELKGSSGGVGEFWTRNHTVSDDAASFQHESRPEGQHSTNVTLHTKHPGVEHYWSEMAGGHGADHEGNWRVPLRPGTPLGIHAITWGEPGGKQHHYDFSAPVDKHAVQAVGAVRQTAGVDHIDLYHRTTPEAAAAIYREKRMKSMEGGPVFFSTYRGHEPDAQGEGYGDGVVHVRVPEHLAQLDDEFPSGEQHYQVHNKDLRPEHFVDDGQARTAARAPYVEDTSDDRQVTFDYHRRTTPAPQVPASVHYHGQDIEPHGRYVSQGKSAVDLPDLESGKLTFQRPLRLHSPTDDPAHPDHWKQQLVRRYNGAKGGDLSQAIRDDGYDGIMTHDKYGPSETVDLTHLTPRTATASFQQTLLAEAAAVDHSDGVMVAFVPPREVAEQLAREGGQPVEDLHVTLAYLGDVADYTPEQLKLLPQIVSSWAIRQKPVELRIGGTGKFNNPAEGQHVLYASVDIPGGAQLHADLARYLQGHGYKLPSEHGWTPHLTLAYVDRHFRFMPHLDEHRWTADQVVTEVGRTRHQARLGTIPSGRHTL